MCFSFVLIPGFTTCFHFLKTLSVYMLNRVGHRIHPCLRPWLVFTGFELWLFNFTDFFCVPVKDSNCFYLMKWVSFFWYIIFQNSDEPKRFLYIFLLLSQAFSKSTKATRVSILYFLWFSIICLVVNTLSLHYLPFLKPFMFF